MSSLIKRPLFATAMVAGLSLLTACGGDEPTGSASVPEVAPPTIAMKDFFKNPEKASFQIDSDLSPETFRTSLAADLVRWKPIIDASGFKID